MMKKTILVILLLLSALLPTYAHSGKTDSNGGHYVSGTGEYHYHHGYSAHYHINGECPYDFKDKTDHSSREKTPSSESTGKSYYTVSESVLKKDRHKNEIYLVPPDEKPGKISVAEFFLINTEWLVVGIFVLYYIIKYTVKGIRYLYYNRKKKKYRIEHTSTTTKKPSKQTYTRYESPQPKIPPRYIPPLCINHFNVIPHGYALTKLLYPIQTNVQPTKSKYTVYITDDGHCYHEYTCETIQNYPIKYCNIYEAEKNHRRQCQVCRPLKPIDLWYNEIQNTIRKDSELYESIRKKPSQTKELQTSLTTLTNEEQANLETIKNNRIRDEIIGIFKTINWQKWTDSSYCDSDAYTRYDRAKKEPIMLLSYDDVEGKAIIKGTSGENYLVTKTSCSCPDFDNKQRHNGPCKHMYYLAMQLYNRQLTKGSET